MNIDLRRARLLLCLPLLAFALYACNGNDDHPAGSSSGTGGSGGSTITDAPIPALSYLHVGMIGVGDLPQVLDTANRSVLLRGVNINALRDDYVDSATPLQQPYPSDPALYADGKCPERTAGVPNIVLCDEDAAQLRALGYNSVRLTVSWSLLEPQPGVIDSVYIDRIAQVVAWFKAQGIYTIIDMHQDAWSKYVFSGDGFNCLPPLLTPVTGAHEADGAPQWASTHLTPACMVNGIRELDLAVEEDFERFWLNLPASDGVGLQDHFANVVLALAQRFHGEPAVAGYELFNEPLPGFLAVPQLVDAVQTFPFYGKVIKTVRTALPDFQQLFFIEPDSLRNVLDQRAEFLPWSLYSDYPNVVYAPHIYTHVFTPDALLAGTLPGAGALAPLFPIPGSYSNAVGDAKALGLPLWIGEFGNGVGDDDSILRQHYDAQDQYAIGSSLWVWKQDGNADNTDGFSVMHGPFPVGAPYPSRVKFSSRAYPIYTAGTLASLSYDADAAGFDLKADSSAVANGDRTHATLIYVPAACNGTITAEGAQLEILKRADGGRDVYAYPQGGSYRVHT